MLLPACAGILLWELTRPSRKRKCFRAGDQAGPYREGAFLLFFMFLSGLLALTMTPAGFWAAILQGKPPHIPPAFRGGINLVPFRQSYFLLRYYLRHGLLEAIWINFPGNVLMFFPVGFFPGLLMSRPRWWKSTLFAAVLSFLIEFFQLFISRGTDIDDLILNTLGGLLGYWGFLFLRRTCLELIQKCAKLRKGSV